MNSFLQPLQQQFQNVSNQINPPVNGFMETILGQSQPGMPDALGMTLLKMTLILYASLVAPKLPTYVLEKFEYVPVKIFVLFLIAWSGSRDPSLSILLAVVFYSSLNVLNGKKMFEKYQDTTHNHYH